MKRLYVFGTRGFPNVQGGVEKHCEQLYPELSDKYHITIFRRKAFLPVERDGELKLPLICLPHASKDLNLFIIPSYAHCIV